MLTSSPGAESGADVGSRLRVVRISGGGRICSNPAAVVTGDPERRPAGRRRRGERKGVEEGGA